MVVILIATIGAVVVSAHPFFSELTDDQKAELKALRKTLKEEGATCTEIRDTMHEQLESYGIDLPTRDEMLDDQINVTRQRLDILERKKVLRQEGYEWDEINEIIQEEFDLEYPTFEGQGMRFGHRFNRGMCIRPNGFMPVE